VEEILIPGERSFRKALENRKKGIRIGNETLRELEVLCDEFKIPFALKEN
jgi:LDH2 family malate/lactate/ureidoglycolate dehydrogenase